MRKETLISIVLAVGVVTSALWVADQSLKSSPDQRHMGWRTEDGDAGSKDSNNSGAENPDSEFGVASSMEQANNLNSPAESDVSKCIVNGKTIYSNQGCPDGAHGQTVPIRNSQGIVSPPKENLEELTANRKAAERVHALQVQRQIATLEPTNKFECAELDKRIEGLDAMARQPQSGSMQDWIREQRKACRDRQFAIRC